MRIIGITGTIGSGKGAVVECLKKHGFLHFSARDFILEEVAKRGLEPIRENTTNVANDLRATHSPSYIIENLYKKAQASGQDSVIESVRALGELNFLQKQGNFHLIAVDADPKSRYERAVKRKSSLDHVTYEKFMADEKREMSSANPTEGSIADCMKRADFTIINDGTLADLDKKVEVILKKMMPK